MKSGTNRLIITIVGTILLPLVVYSVYEISSVKEEEKVIEKIYRDQLDAILFSVNQYSDDVINGLMDKLENQLDDSLKINKIDPYLSFSEFKVIILKGVESNRFSIIKVDTNFVSENWISIQDSLFKKNKEIPEQLLRYKEKDYRKIEPKGLYSYQGASYQVVHSVLEASNGENILMTGLLHINGFAENVLAPKLQQIAEDELIITLGNKMSDKFIYLTDTLKKEVMFKKPMWLFPEMEIGISSKNKTVKELVDERTQFNLIATIVLIFLLVFGFGLVVRNLKKEIQLTQAKSDFVSNVSHELRTPLSLISMFAETLVLDRAPREKRKEYEEIIFKETNRLTNIVNKILNFSQIEADMRVYHATKVNLNDLINDLMHDYGYHLERNGFTYEIIKEENIPEVLIDKDGLYEAMVNLIDNAVKYSSTEKHVIIRTGKGNHKAYIEVEDKGVGIAPDKINLIFEKFYRVSDGDVHATKGAGLGLALVNHIVSAHDGNVEVESTPGKGSIFRMVFYLNKNE